MVWSTVIITEAGYDPQDDVEKELKVFLLPCSACGSREVFPTELREHTGEQWDGDSLVIYCETCQRILTKADDVYPRLDLNEKIKELHRMVNGYNDRIS